MAITPMTTTNQLGKKLSFADWIAQISPEDTLFLSKIGSESIDQISFKWQTDVLDPVSATNYVVEGSVADTNTIVPTKEIDNQCQILRKVVSVTDTADRTANYGRGRELQYQMVKSGASIKRDLEATFLTNGAQKDVAGARLTGGVRGLIGYSSGNVVNVKGSTHTGTVADPDTGAVVVKSAAVGITTGTATVPVTVAPGYLQEFEDAVLDMTSQLYIANSKADIIMAHPSMAPAFSALMEKYGSGTTGTSNSVHRVRYFENNKSLDLEVNEIITPLGQKFKLVFNRFMPLEASGANAGSTFLLFFSAADWDQMVFRAPAVTDLAKLGSSETKMIEMEVGLRHRHPYASAILNIIKHA